MHSNYFDQKIISYFLNIIAKKPIYITYPDSVKIWHELFSESELRTISREISKITSTTIAHLIEAGELPSPEKSNIQNLPKDNKSSEVNLLELEATEDFFGNLKTAPKEKIKRISGIIIKHANKKRLNKKAIVNDRLNEIKTLFKLSDIDIELMTLYYCTEFSDEFENIVQQHRNQDDISRPVKAKNFISNIIQYPSQLIMQSLGKSSRLISLGILESNRSMNISSEFVDYLSGFSNDGLIEKYAKKISTIDSLDISSHLISQDKLSTLKAILESDLPCSILFYGKPGTGKSELARTIAKEVGLDLYAINILDTEGEDDRNLRKRSMFAVQNHPSMSEQIILIDECDQLINSKVNYFFNTNSGSDQKAWLNEYLDINICKTIWITNSIESIDESVVRRFNYILEFDDLSNNQRMKILKTITAKSNCSFLNEDDISVFSKSEKLTSGHFSIAIKTAQNLKVDDTKKKEYFTNILKEHQNTLGHKPLRLKSINANYCIKGLNIDQSPETVIEQSKKILEQIELNDSDINLNTLLYGPPGTGKTEFVKYLGQELGKEILLKRASDLLSMWVGGSEKNIRKAFEDAEREKKILFIDEADSLLSPREGHNRTWETTQVNEILTCMENFRGILLCATNHVDNLDMAAQRRFLFKMKFDYLDNTGVMHFYEKFFSKFVSEDISNIEKENIKSIQGLTPSDFNNLKRKFEIITPQNHQEILEQLQLEVGFKKSLFKKKIGMVQI